MSSPTSTHSAAPPRFSKDFSIFGAPRSKRMSSRMSIAESVASNKTSHTARPPTIAAPTPKKPPKPSGPPEKVHHSTLLLLEEHGLAQAPPHYWTHKTVLETPAARGARRVGTFYPDNPGSQMWTQEQRFLKKRRAERNRRSQEPGYLEGPAVARKEVLEELEDVHGGLQMAAHWQNVSLDLKVEREHAEHASKGGGWFGAAAKEHLMPETAEESKARMNLEVMLNGVMPMGWTRPTLQPPAPAAPVIAETTPPKTPEKPAEKEVPAPRNSSENRNSRFSSFSNFSTFSKSSTRSSMFSIPQSEATTPPSSGYPSPTLEPTPEDDFWKSTGIVPVELPSTR